MKRLSSFAPSCRIPVTLSQLMYVYLPLLSTKYSDVIGFYGVFNAVISDFIVLCGVSYSWNDYLEGVTSQF